jgi:hypothetical protein
MKEVAKPFLISLEQPQKLYSYETSFKIGRNLNQTEANQLAARINFSTKNYELEVVSST